MATRKAKAVIKINKPTDYKSTTELADAVIQNITLNAITFPNPDPPLATMITQVIVVRDYANKVNNGDRSQIEGRNENSTILYTMLQQQLVYVNHIANGNRMIIRDSGFPLSDDPNPLPVPPQIIIKRIVDGSHHRTAKIYIEKLGMYVKSFIIEMTTTPDIDTSWKYNATKSSSRDLIIENMVHGQEVWIRICASNAHGEGPWSVPVPFISQK